MVARGSLASAPTAHPTIAPYLRRYEHPAQIGVKVNLYRAVEVEGLARALGTDDLQNASVECVMVGDSYFMTHLGRSTTTMHSPEEQEWAMSTLVGLVAEVREAINLLVPSHRRPFLLADLPDGSFPDTASAYLARDRFRDAGADAVKIETSNNIALKCIEALAEKGTAVFGHLGYTPQHGDLRRYGDTRQAADRLFADARRLRDAGACGLILEMVSEPVNQALCRPDPIAVPVYSIFSGRARWGGQSLNAWDAVVRPPRPRRHFPPTAVIDSGQVADTYTGTLIGDRLAELLRLALNGWYPLSPRSTMADADLDWLSDVNPWREN